MQEKQTIKLYHMDSHEYRGCIRVEGKEWRFEGVEDAHLVKTVKGMPLKALLANLICFELVYDMEE